MTQAFQVALPGGDTLSSLVSAAAIAQADSSGQLIDANGKPLTPTLTDAGGQYPPLTVHALTQAAANAYSGGTTGPWATTATDVWGFILDDNGYPTGILNQYLACMKDPNAVANGDGFRLTGVDGVVANSFDTGGIIVSGICVAAQS